MQAQVQRMIDKLEHLSPERLAEVLDFIDFLQQRDNENQLQNDYLKTSEASFSKVWDNEDDAKYDAL